MKSQSKVWVRLCWTWIALVCVVTIIHGLYRTWWVAEGAGGNVQPNLLNPGQANDLAYIKHNYMTYLHLVTGIVIYLLGPVQFLAGVRRQWPKIHKWSGYIFFVTVIVAGITGILMGFLFPVGGTSETSSSLIFSVIMIFCALRSIQMILNKKVELHRQWMIRSYMISLGPATMHAIIPFFIQLGGKDIGEALALSLWIGFTIQLILAEVWIHHSSPSGKIKGRSPKAREYNAITPVHQERYEITL
ncbi:DUF2306 domain-containing protein [Serratia fonticola]|uniref:DUF2306 domain-containing protein n=1 Tax=Serratia fonticola TaxID=47917 RepID=UPI0005870380|nr:DUF2306 domain-containing protein [Serratia fonticola]MEB7885635.1 DUF2306 domain-containing protein [Serratia fonticola]